MMPLDQITIEKTSEVGELLIRAVAVLGTLTAEQLDSLRIETNGNLPDCLLLSLDGAKQCSPSVRQSLKTHPPKSFTDQV